MFHWMRKHTRIILIGVCIVVVPTFVLWGGYAGKSRANKAAKSRRDTTGMSVATVGTSPVAAAEFQQRLSSEAERRSQYGGKRPSVQEMASDGTAERILEGMIDSVLLGQEARRKNFVVDKKYLIERLKKEQSFKDKDGNFSVQMWNSWIESDPQRKWTAIYADLQDQVAREMLLKQVMAPARVLENDVRKQFEENFTKIQIKYVSIDPEITPTPEQIQAEFDKDPSKYQIPEKRNVEFVAVSLAPARPALLDDLVKRARAGEDFAELAKQNSQGPDAQSGGSMDWVEPGPNDPEHIKALFATPLNTVSEPIESGGAFYIFKVEEERANEKTGAQDVKARQIVLRPKLEDADRSAREAQANQIVSKAKDQGDLKTAAEAAGLTISTTQGVSVESTAIENIPAGDTGSFRIGVTKIGVNEISDVIKSSQNLYIAKVVQIDPPVPQPLDAVREKVSKDTENTIRRSPEHADEVKALTDKIAAAAKSLPEIVEKFPELKLGIKESKEFSRKDFLFSEGIYLQAVDVYGAIGQKEPGAFGGPLRGMRGDQYFVELVKKVPPTDENWKTDWPKEEESLRKSTLAAKKNQLVTDYLADLRDRRAKDSPIQRNSEVIAKVLGTGKEETDETPKEEAPAPLKHAPVTPGQKVDLGPPGSE